VLHFVLRRLFGALLSLWAAITLAFLVLHLTPGDPAEAALSQSTAPQDSLEQRREALGLDLPLPVQYGHFWLNLVRGDLGVSWAAGQPVSTLIGQQLGATVSLAAGGMAAAVIMGVGLGLLAVANQGNLISEVSRGAAGFMLGMPVVFSGILLIFIFSIRLDWLPATGQGTFRQLVLPSLVVGLSAAGGIARAVDTGVSETLSQPFMRAARAKGLSPAQALRRHAVRVGLLPTLDIIALQFGFLLGGAVVTETIFARQGLGRVMLAAVLNKDLPVVLGVVILAALSYSLLNLLADLSHAWLDPRIRLNVE
jgi:ABC-type dipeptide/oligopeptide/nickel transport system permease component